jgi:hypothetical protein
VDLGIVDDHGFGLGVNRSRIVRIATSDSW